MNKGFSVVTPLMDHQRQAVEKFIGSKWNAAFMDMGTGKTLVAIALAQIRRLKGKVERVVWFTPVSLMDNVKREIEKHTDASGLIYVFSGKTTDNNIDLEKFFYVIGIESMSSSSRVVLAANKIIDEKTMVIVDESDLIKGYGSKRTVRITSIASKAKYRMIMTGTPVSQGVVDLYSQMKFLSPKILGYHSFYGFSSNHLVYSAKHKGLIVGSLNTEELAHKIRPYVFQVSKDECIDLPEKVHVFRHFKLTSEQLGLYEQIKDHFLNDLVETDENEWDGRIRIFRLFMALQQVASGFTSNGKGKFFDIDSHRIDLLISVINEIPVNEQVIVWCKYQHDVDLVCAALSEEFCSDSVSQYTGAISQSLCNKNEQRFVAGDSRFFVAIPSKGGRGLTLTNASYAIFYNTPFKYGDVIQAEDRIHRIGQTKKSTYISLYAECGIEDRIYRAILRKSDAREEFRNEVEAVKNLAENKVGRIAKLISLL